MLSDEITFTVNFDVPCQILHVKFTHFQVVARVSKVGIPERSKKTCKCRKFSNIIIFLCCRRKVLLNHKTSFPCEKPRVFQSDLNISQILTNFNDVCDTNTAFHIFPVFLKNKNSLETLIAFFINSLPKGFSWQNIEKSDISILSANFSKITGSRSLTVHKKLNS